MFLIKLNFFNRGSKIVAIIPVDVGMVVVTYNWHSPKFQNSDNHVILYYFMWLCTSKHVLLIYFYWFNSANT